MEVEEVEGCWVKPGRGYGGERGEVDWLPSPAWTDCEEGKVVLPEMVRPPELDFLDDEDGSTAPLEATLSLPDDEDDDPPVNQPFRGNQLPPELFSDPNEEETVGRESNPCCW